MLAADDTIEALALLEAPVGAIVSLSGDGRTLRAWAAADGALLWEHHLPGESPPAASPPGGDGGGDESLAPVSGDKAASAGAAGGVAGSPALAVLPPGEGRAAPLLAVHVGGTVHVSVMRKNGRDKVRFDSERWSLLSLQPFVLL